MDGQKRVLIVMDALKEFSVDLIQWVLENFTFRETDDISILGITPWLNIPLSSKTWSDIWGMNIEDLTTFQENTNNNHEFNNDPKYQKIQQLLQLCQTYGVVPKIRTGMGHPQRLLVEEQINILNPTYVVFDRYHDKKNIGYYEQKLTCDMVVMKDDGVDMIRGRRNEM